MKKKMKKKMPTRRTTEQYWSEEQFYKLKDLPPAKLTSRGEFPWRLLAHIISLDHNIEPIRKIIGRRLMGAKRHHAGQQALDDMLLTLWNGGFITLEPPPRHPRKSGDLENTVDSGGSSLGSRFRGNDEKDEKNETETKIVFQYAYPTEKLPILMKLRGVNPLYGLFLTKHLGIADRGERLQAFESLLELPPSIGPNVRVPKQDVMPNGPLSVDRLDPMLLQLGLATVAELVPKTEEEEEEEREKRRHFAGWLEERVYVIPLAEKLKRLFEYENPKVFVKINPVWAAGEVLLEFQGDFNKYIVAKSLQKQEGVIFRHLLRLILLFEEFIDLPPTDGSAEEWKADIQSMLDQLIVCCRTVDPQSTEETLERAKEPNLDGAL
jgi:hypothetical protein